MTPRIQNKVFGLLAMTLPLVACAQDPAPAAPAGQVAAARSVAPAPQLVQGLPDFTQLVDQVGPGVVKVDTVIGARRNSRAVQQGPDMDQMPDFFRRFFGPDFQMPGPGQQGPDNGPRGRGMGSGFIISNDGYVLTNHHVIDGAESVKVTLSDRREFTAKVVGSDAQYDVALLKVEGRNLPTVRVGDSNTLKPGQWVVAIGSPFGLDHSVTAGIVSALGRNTGGQDQRYVPFIQTDVAINQGNSGGPLLNTRGEVVGINSQIFSASGGYMGISFAIPIDLAMNAVEQIKTTGKVVRGQIGVALDPQPIDEVTAKGLKLPDVRGALVNEVVAGSPSEKAGLQQLDVIRSINGREIQNSAEVPPMIGVISPGNVVQLGIMRNGASRTISVKVGAEAGRELREGDSKAVVEPRVDGGANIIGLTVVDIDEVSKRRLGLDRGGVRVVESSGAALRAGLRPGVVVTQIGRSEVEGIAGFNQLLKGFKAGDVVMLLVYYPESGSSRFVAVSLD